MQYAKLTHKNFILAHFDANYPRIGKAIHIKNIIDINTIDDDGKHILDWVMNGYSGDNKLKVDMFFHLCALGAKISLTQDSTFEKIMDMLSASNYPNNKHAQDFLKYFDDYNRVQCFLKSEQYSKNFINNLQVNNTHAPHKMMILKNIPHFWNNGECAVNFCLQSFLKPHPSSLNTKYIFILHTLLEENSSICLENFSWNTTIIKEVNHCSNAHDVMQYIILKDNKKDIVFSDILSKIVILNDYNTLQSQLSINTVKKSYTKI